MSAYSLEKAGINPTGTIYYNLEPASLIEHAIKRAEGHLSRTGALVVNTGDRTGRSAADKFIVDSPEIHDEIAWGSVNQPISQEIFDALYDRMTTYLSNQDLYIFDGMAGASVLYHQKIRVVNEYASEALFIHQLLLHQSPKRMRHFVPDYTIIVAPGFECIPERDGTKSDAAIMIDFVKRKVLIAGTRYAGEIKKSIFTIMNYVLPHRGVLPMHCSANTGRDGSTALFFGLSGTGKTTLSASPDRWLIGDDEHGWSDEIVFNFEGGCYAKCIDLTEEQEPEIFHAIRFGALVENVVMDPQTRELDFTNDRYTANTRVGYPVSYISNTEQSGIGRVPDTVIFLTADAFGVLPPIAKLNHNQAMYYFLSGFTSKVAGTEIGINEPSPTFSACFGEPFLPLDPVRYALMLKEKVEAADANVYLVNTGWNGQGERMPIKYTRAMIQAALDGTLENVPQQRDPYFGFMVPTRCPECPSKLLMPSNSWTDKKAYELMAYKLADMFHENFEEKYPEIPSEIRNAGPIASTAEFEEEAI